MAASERLQLSVESGHPLLLFDLAVTINYHSAGLFVKPLSACIAFRPGRLLLNATNLPDNYRIGCDISEEIDRQAP